MGAKPTRWTSVTIRLACCAQTGRTRNDHRGGVRCAAAVTCSTLTGARKGLAGRYREPADVNASLCGQSRVRRTRSSELRGVRKLDNWEVWTDFRKQISLTFGVAQKCGSVAIDDPAKGTGNGDSAPDAWWWHRRRARQVSFAFLSHQWRG